jgi:two-component system phosphate regulon sensor histidine kinase PhoR
VYEYLKKEIALFVLLLFFVVALGVISGQWFLSVLLIFFGYMIWHLRQVYFLERWLLGLDDDQAEKLSGIWLYVVENIRRYQKTGRKRKRRIARLLQRFNTTLELVPDAIIVADVNWTIEWVNAAAKNLLGISRRSIGSSLEDLIPPDLLQAYNASPEQSLPFELQSPVTGNMELEMKITPFGEDQILITAHDITELKKVESIRREFLANVSHELRTPLTVISGYLEMMDGEDWPEAYHEAVRASRRQAQRMQLLVSDLLMLSKLEMHDNAPLIEDTVDVGQLLAGLRADAVTLSDKAAHKILLQAEGELMMRGNEAELSSAFGNLIFNAVLHTPPGTKIIIGWHHKKDALEFSVTDNGPGIEARHLARLTERFYRIDKARSREKGGTGLGLSITRHVVQRHGGEIKIDSVVGQGTTFRCLFPLQRRV